MNAPLVYQDQKVERQSLLILFILSIPLAQSVMSLDFGPHNRYAMAHYLLTYEFGFTKRALFGQLLSGISFLSLGTLALIATCITAACIAMTYAVLCRPLCNSLLGALLLAFLLSGPGFLPHVAACAAFLDNLLLIVLLTCIVILRKWQGAGAWIAITALSALSLLVHEAFVLLYYPVILVLLLDEMKDGRLGRKVLALHLAVVLGVLALVLTAGRLDVPAQQFNAYLRSRTDLPLEENNLMVRALQFSLIENWAYLAEVYTMPRFVVGQSVVILSAAPYFVALAVLLSQSMSHRGSSSRRFWITASILCAPVLLMLVGHDVVRWTAIACLNVSIYIVLCESKRVAAEGDPSPLEPTLRSPWFTAAFAYSLIVGAFSIAGNRLVGKLGALIPR